MTKRPKTRSRWVVITDDAVHVRDEVADAKAISRGASAAGESPRVFRGVERDPITFEVIRHDD